PIRRHSIAPRLHRSTTPTLHHSINPTIHQSNRGWLGPSPLRRRPAGLPQLARSKAPARNHLRQHQPCYPSVRLNVRRQPRRNQRRNHPRPEWRTPQTSQFPQLRSRYARQLQRRTRRFLGYSLLFPPTLRHRNRNPLRRPRPHNVDPRRRHHEVVLGSNPPPPPPRSLPRNCISPLP